MKKIFGNLKDEVREYYESCIALITQEERIKESIMFYAQLDGDVIVRECPSIEDCYNEYSESWSALLGDIIVYPTMIIIINKCKNINALGMIYGYEGTIIRKDTFNEFKETFKNNLKGELI